MNKSDTLIAGLVNALDAIKREAAKGVNASPYFMYGIAEQAISNVRAHQERNADGYFVVKVS